MEKQKDGLVMKVLHDKNMIRLQVCKCLIWFAFVMLIGMFCVVNCVWFIMPLTLINIIFYMGVECWIGSLFYLLNENYKLLKKDIKFFEDKLEKCKTKTKAE